MGPRQAETVKALQTMQAYWQRCAEQVREWCEKHPDNAAGLYDWQVYQSRAAASYAHLQVVRGF